MKKSLLSILLVVFLAVISGCADTESGTGGGSPLILQIFLLVKTLH